MMEVIETESILGEFQTGKEITLPESLPRRPESMARCTPVLWKHKRQANGHFPIWLRFESEGRTLYSSLGVSIHPRFWNDAKAEVRKGHPQSEGINALIQVRLNEVEAARLRMLRKGEPVTAEALKEAMAPPEHSAPICYIAYVRDFLAGIEAKGNIRRFKRENTVMNLLEAFAGSPLPFEKITPALLRRYETHLLTERGNKASTVAGAMKVIRIHFRRAMKEGVVPRDSDPFFAYSAPKAERPERHKLTASELARIKSLDLGGFGSIAPLIARVRDAFLFSLYCAGPRFADVARFTVGNITEEIDAEGIVRLRLSYRAGKTKKRVTVRLMPQADRIARAYMADERGMAKKADAFLFPMLQAYDLSTPRKTENAIGSQNALHNKYLKEIAERAGVKANVSFHIARHSFADLARKRGWDVYVISKALAHSSIGVTEHYMAANDIELVDEKLDTLFEDGNG